MSAIGSKEVWDFTMSYGDLKTYIGEIKCVNCESNKYEYILLEVAKAKNLVYSAYKYNIVNAPLYCMHYEDDLVRILKLTPSLLTDYTPVWMTTGRKSKLVYLIPHTEANIIQL